MASPWIGIRWHRPPISLRIDRRTPAVLLGLAGLAAIAMLFSIAWGTETIPPLDAAKALLGLESASPADLFVVRSLRLPRSLAAFLVGIGLGTAGTILQGLTRNPLAAPGIIGINAGASLAIVLSLVLLPTLPVGGLPIVAFVGSLLMSAAIYLLAWDSRDSSPVRLILVGIGLSLAAGALTSLLLALGGINRVSLALVWLVGSVYGRNWNHILALLPWLIASIPLTLALAPELNILSLSEPVAKGLGLRIQRSRTLLLVTAAALSGASVATAGTIGFVGLLAPHLARRLVGPSHLELIPTAALTGGLLVLTADGLSRVLFPTVEMPCGIMTVGLGVPYFLYLLVKSPTV
ncbi:iron ABC transporter permease [Synechococcus sp. PCC 7336]|uniref:FecCD family ABC transporter permease n=1 Tax=Synechococcus sp. PCC 7336 TaxID=195250 RepID=UPI000376647C|nr:iron ABC transporter permease [Synechococcus sp. PCC 7336]